MKRFIAILAIVLSGVAAKAQEGLFVEDLFNGDIISYKMMKRAFIHGSQLQPYKLDTYKSLSFTVNEGVLHTVEVLVLRDAYDAVDKQTDYVGEHLSYALISLPQTGTGRNRYLCYQAKEIKGLWDVTVVYLRGSATLEDLNNMFNKKEK